MKVLVLILLLVSSFSFAGNNAAKNIIDGANEKVKEMNRIVEDYEKSSVSAYELRRLFEESQKRAHELFESLSQFPQEAVTDLARPALEAYAKTLIAATQVQKLEKAWFLKEYVDLALAANVIVLVDYNVLTQEQMSTLFSEIKLENLNASWKNQFAEAQQQIKDGNYSHAQLKAVFVLFQKSFGNVSWNIISRIQNDWQVQALDRLAQHFKEKRGTYLGKQSQEMYLGLIESSTDARRLKIFSAALELNLDLMKNAEFLKVVDQNKVAADALVELVKMQSLFKRMKINNEKTYVVMLSRTTNEYQVEALKHINNLDLLKPQLLETRWETIHGRKKTFADKVDGLFFNTEHLFKDFQYPVAVYKELDPADISSVTNLLLNDIPKIKSGADLESFRASLATRFKGHKYPNDQIEALYNSINTYTCSSLF